MWCDKFLFLCMMFSGMLVGFISVVFLLFICVCIYWCICLFFRL